MLKIRKALNQIGPNGKGILTAEQVLFCLEPEDWDRDGQRKLAFLCVHGAMDNVHTIMIPNVEYHQNSMAGYVLCTGFSYVKFNT
jgi:hypothetical protein